MIKDWQKTTLSFDQTHHLFDNEPFYKKRFYSVLKFHHPGIAPVQDETGAYHIDLLAHPCYAERYLKTFGFYCDRAAVKDEKGWFHVLTNGKRFYLEYYVWCGNYQENYCVVCDADHHYFHIDVAGNPLYSDRYSYVGDFKDHVAVVQREDGKSSHIDPRGNLIHHKWFLNLDVYHKNFARAENEEGWFHIDLSGTALYSRRFKMIEPFYNGCARVETQGGELIIINERGETIKTLRETMRTELQMVSADLVGFWKTQTIRAGVEMNLFEILPASEDSIEEQIPIEKKCLIKLLRGLGDLDLVYKHNHRWHLTLKGMLLQEKHPLSLSHAARHWGKEDYLTWMDLAESLKTGESYYSKKWGKPLFDWLDQDNDRVVLYQKAMAPYAQHDYEEIAHFTDLNRYHTVVDAGGGFGVLLEHVLKHYPHLKGILLERESVIHQLRSRRLPFALKPFDLFKPWPIQADVIFLSRILHDWSNEECLIILKHAKEALSIDGVIYVIERVVHEECYDGGLLDLNMFLLTGGTERTEEDFKRLTESVNLCVSAIIPLKYGNYMIKIEHQEDRKE